MNLEEVKKKNLQKILDELNSACHGYLTEPENRYLTDISGCQLRQELIGRKKKSPTATPLVDAVCQFHDKQRESQNAHFALVDVLTKNALVKTHALEKQITLNSVDNYPLYGFILSVKESIRMKGYESTCGLVNNSKKHEKDVKLIDYLESQGAVIISRANVPQLLFAMESWNHLYGTVLNPWNKQRTAGGSSGGDAALVALGHVNGAFGSDGAGSLRIPALFCGICAMSMSSQRMDMTNHATLYENMEKFSSFPDPQFIFSGNIGPLARNVDDLSVLTQALVNEYQVNPRLAPVPWKADLLPVTRVGVFIEWDNLFYLTETNRRAMRMAKESLVKIGIEVVDIDLRPLITDLVQTVGTIYYKNRMLIGGMAGQIPINEPVLPVYKEFKRAVTVPTIARLLFMRLNRDPLKHIFVTAYHNSLAKNSAYLARRLQEHKERIVKLMADAGVKVALCPGMMPAVPHGTSHITNFWAMYMFVWNGLKFPSGALPVTRVQEDEQFYKPKGNFAFDRGMKECMKNSKGLPVGVQAVSLPFHEEYILQVMKVIEKGVSFK